MKKTKCYSVTLQKLVSISNKAYKAYALDGSTTLIPKSQVFGKDYKAQQVDTYWISAWILEQKSLPYSNKKTAWFNRQSGKMMPTYHFENHKPDLLNPVTDNIISELSKCTY